MAVEQIFIEFVTDGSQLAPAIDQLVEMGKVDKQSADIFKKTNTELAQRAKNWDVVAAGTKKAGAEITKTTKTVAPV